MRISRIFRKYSRVLLLVFMSLLLVVFLLGDVIGRGARNRADRDVEIGTAFGKPITHNQTLVSRSEFELAQRLMLQVPPVSMENTQEAYLAIHLLMEEARRAGVVIGPDRIKSIFARVDPQTANLILDRERRQTGRSLNAIYAAAGRVAATVEYAGYQASALAGMSLPEIEHLYRDQNQEARILASVIDSKAFLDRIPEPTEEELLAHFEQCKDRDPAHTDEERVYGYRIGDRVKLEYITVDPAEIEAVIRVSSREAQRYYEDHAEKYTREVDAPPVTLEQNPEPQKIQMTYEEAKDQVREDCRKAKAIQEAQKLMNQIHQEAIRPWLAAPFDENNRRKAPAPEDIASFEALKIKYSKEYSVILKTTDLITTRELSRERGLARAIATISSQQTKISDLAWHVDGLAEFDAKDELPLLHLNEPGELVMETRTLTPGEPAIPYQAYVFRVLEVKPAGPPESLDEVRDRVVSDVKQLKAFEMAAEQANILAEAAKQQGLEAAVSGADELRQLIKGSESDTEDMDEEEAKRAASAAERYLKMLTPTEPEQFQRQPRFLQGIGYSPTLHERAFAPVDEGGPDMTQEHPVVAVPMARSMKWAVIEVREILPVYQGDFEQQRDQIEAQASMRKMQQFWVEWFDVENILARTGFKPAAPMLKE